MRVPVAIDLDDLAESFVTECTNEQAIAFLLAVDKEHGDADFTETLILELVRSLRSDYGQAEFRELLSLINDAAGGVLP